MARRRPRRRRAVRAVALGGAVLLGLALVLADRTEPPRSHLPATVLTDQGRMRVEEEYLPGVVDCEIAHYTRSMAALEAQAIAARTYLARHLEARGRDARVPIGPHFQCWRRPIHARSRRAVERTQGVVLRHRGALINANYASGAHRLRDDCTPRPPREHGYAHPSWDAMRAAWRRGQRFRSFPWTEVFVTDNRGRRGAEVVPTLQAGRHPTNRGALGQYAAICLAERQGLRAPEILRVFYGEDVDLGW
jgi:hypothetical protein